MSAEILENIKHKCKRVCGIYKITNPKGRIYIGQSVNVLYRLYQYKKYYCKRQARVYASLIKYGAEAHEFEIIHYCKPEELNHWEKYYVDLYDTFNTENGLNLKDGGGDYGTHSDETRKKLSLANKGKKYSEERKKIISKKMKEVVTEEFRKRMGDISRGRTASAETRKKMSESRKGIKLSDETKDKLREINLWKKHSDETKEKIRESSRGKHDYLKGFKHSDETKRKISERMRGERHPMYGKKHSEEVVAKMRERVGEKNPLYGIPRSEEVKKKISEAQKGRKFSEEHKAKLRKPHKKRIANAG